MRQTRNLLLHGFVIAITTATIGLAACRREPPPPAAPADIVIGAILPLTAAPPTDLSSYGVDTRKAVELAADQQNRKGGINGAKITLKIEDSQGAAAKAVGSLHKLADVDKAVACVGPITSPEVLAVAPIANQKRVPIISPSATSVDITTAGEHIFRTINVDTIETEEFAAYVRRNMSISAVAILANQAAGTMSYADSFEKYFRALDGKILLKEILPQNSADYRAVINKVLARRPAAIYVAGVSNEIGEVVRQIRSVNTTIVLLSYQSAEDRRVSEIAGSAANGLTFSSTTLPDQALGTAHAAFVREFTSRYGQKPGIFASEIYDAFNVIVEAARRCGNQRHLSICLNETKGFTGASGTITFDANGDVHKPVAFYKYENGKPTLIEMGHAR
jgi:branched-chain amino acid transport system substrate-binding protein